MSGKIQMKCIYVILIIIKYIEMTINVYELKEKPCCFLTESGTCKIEKCKPEGYMGDSRNYKYFKAFGIKIFIISISHNLSHIFSIKSFRYMLYLFPHY